MAQILTPGFLKWDGTKFVLDPDVEGQQGPAGPTGATGPAGPTGPQGPAGTGGSTEQLFYTNVGSSSLWSTVPPASGNPGNAITTSNVFSPLLELAGINIAADGILVLSATVAALITQENTAISGYAEFKFKVDSTEVDGGGILYQGIPNAAIFESNLGCVALSRVVPITAGTHTIQLLWRVSGQAATRQCIVREQQFPSEEHGQMLVRAIPS